MRSYGMWVTHTCCTYHFLPCRHVYRPDGCVQCMCTACAAAASVHTLVKCLALKICVSHMQTTPSRSAKYASSFITTGSTGAQFCGEYDQLTSQFPGAGPCYAVWAQTYPWFYRQVFLLPVCDSCKICMSTLQQPLL